MKKVLFVMAVAVAVMAITALAGGDCPKAKKCSMAAAAAGCPASTNAPACTNAPVAAQPAK